MKTRDELENQILEAIIKFNRLKKEEDAHKKGEWKGQGLDALVTTMDRCDAQFELEDLQEEYQQLYGEQSTTEQPTKKKPTKKRATKKKPTKKKKGSPFVC